MMSVLIFKEGIDTWQMLHDSLGTSFSVEKTHLLCSRHLMTISSPNPVLTFPMRSSKANNSYQSLKNKKIKLKHHPEELRRSSNQGK